MIIVVASYDPDYFKDNTFVFSDFETRAEQPIMSRIQFTQTQFRNQATSNSNALMADPFPQELQTVFARRSFDIQSIGQAEQWTGKIVGNYGPQMLNAIQYPAMDNPVVRVNVTSFDLNDTNATNNSTTPVVG